MCIQVGHPYRLLPLPEAMMQVDHKKALSFLMCSRVRDVFGLATRGLAFLTSIIGAQFLLFFGSIQGVDISDCPWSPLATSPELGLQSPFALQS